MSSSILKSLSGTDKSILTNESDLRKSNPSSFTATISGVNKVYNLFPGTVLFLGFYKGMGTVTIAVSNHEIVRYLNLKDIKTWSFASVNKGELIGEAYSLSGLQFEYCTQWKGESKYPVRISNSIYFKQNPIDILDGKYTPVKEVDLVNGSIRVKDKVKFTQDQLLEWGPPNVDDSAVYVQGATIIQED